MKRTLAALSFVTLAALSSTQALAQSAVHFSEGERVDPMQVARILSAHTSVPMPIRTRSIRLLDTNTPAHGVQQAAAAAASEPSALSLPVRFAFDSAEIAAGARPQLDALASGIKMLPPDQTVTIEGHTDATGSHDYNMALSQRRAIAVKQYLVRIHGIDARRLSTAGLGEAQPIDGSDPFDGRNRRVQFRGG